jgi:putative (di)nucleoside polyphosphate hydrolase
MSPAAVFFRAGVGAAILDARKRVLACERFSIPGAWQLPQGGMKEGEAPIDTVWREIREETGIRRRYLELLHRCPEPLAYALPPEYRTRKTGMGQVQYWFLFRLKAGDEVIDLGVDGEFRAWRWMTFHDLIEAAVAFRRPLYRRLAECFRDHL